MKRPNEKSLSDKIKEIGEDKFLSNIMKTFRTFANRYEIDEMKEKFFMALVVENNYLRNDNERLIDDNCQRLNEINKLQLKLKRGTSRRNKKSHKN